MKQFFWSSWDGFTRDRRRGRVRQPQCLLQLDIRETIGCCTTCVQWSKNHNGRRRRFGTPFSIANSEARRVNSEPLDIGTMELTTEAFARACELMQATYTTDGFEDGLFSLDFRVSEKDCQLIFGLSNNQALLVSPSAWNTQFVFECNAITFHPNATPEGYMLWFHMVSGSTISAKLLVAGDSHGVTHLRQYSVPATEGEVEFPRQL